MNATMRYNRVAEKINRALKCSAVTTCQVPKGKFDNYFKDGVALQIDDYDMFKLVMQVFGGSTIEVYEHSFYIEPYNTTYIGVWED